MTTESGKWTKKEKFRRRMGRSTAIRPHRRAASQKKTVKQEYYQNHVCRARGQVSFLCFRSASRASFPQTTRRSLSTRCPRPRPRRQNATTTKPQLRCEWLGRLGRRFFYLVLSLFADVSTDDLSCVGLTIVFFFFSYSSSSHGWFVVATMVF